MQRLPRHALGLTIGIGMLTACGEHTPVPTGPDLTTMSTPIVMYQAWGQNSAAIPSIGETDDRFGEVLATGDFNGDGLADLAVGVPNEDSSEGAVNIIYAVQAQSGLAAPVSTPEWRQSYSSKIPGASEPDDKFGKTLAAGDFNGDGYEDLAIGVPGEDLGSIQDAGMVNVLYGGSTGLRDTGAQDFHQDIPGIEGMAEADDYFGSSLAAGDFNGDGRTDLAIGAPGEGVNYASGAGMVTVLFGSFSGLKSQGSVTLHQDKPNTPDKAENGDNFGMELAAGHFHSSTYDSLAVLINDQLPGRHSGVVQVFRGERNGNLTAAEFVGVLERAAYPDPMWLDKLVAGDFDNSGLDDIAVSGVHYWEESPVDVYYNNGFGLSEQNNQMWDQDSPGIQGLLEFGDDFGYSLSVGDFNGDGASDLAIGVPSEDLRTLSRTGAVNILFGGPQGLSARGNFILDQDSVGVAGAPEPGDRFGFALAAGDFDGRAGDDLAIGVPDEDLGALSNAGMVNVLYHLDGP